MQFNHQQRRNSNAKHPKIESFGGHVEVGGQMNNLILRGEEREFEYVLHVIIFFVLVMSSYILIV